MKEFSCIDAECAFFSDPDKRSRELTQTPENQRLLNAYRSTYTTFIKYKNTFPESNEAFEELRNASETLAQIRFDEDIPNSVKLFFEATNRGGASLELLTDEVVTWLRTKNSLGSYIVSAKN